MATTAPFQPAIWRPCHVAIGLGALALTRSHELLASLGTTFRLDEDAAFKRGRTSASTTCIRGG